MRLVSVRSRVRTSLEAVRVGVVGNISACHADAPGSIPGHGVTLFVSCTLRIILLAGISNNFVLFLVTNYRGLINYASIAQLAEHLLRKEKVTSSILVGGYLFAWSSWLWRSPHTREVPSSSLGANTTKIFANKFLSSRDFFARKNQFCHPEMYFFSHNLFTLGKKKGSYRKR